MEPASVVRHPSPNGDPNHTWQQRSLRFLFADYSEVPKQIRTQPPAHAVTSARQKSKRATVDGEYVLQIVFKKTALEQLASLSLVEKGKAELGV